MDCVVTVNTRGQWLHIIRCAPAAAISIVLRTPIVPDTAVRTGPNVQLLVNVDCISRKRKILPHEHALRCLCGHVCARVSYLVNAAEEGLGGLVLVWGAACLNGPQQRCGGQGHDPVQQTQQQGHYQLPTHTVRHAPKLIFQPKQVFTNTTQLSVVSLRNFLFFF